VVVSRPDRRRGRGQGVGPSPVKAAAMELGLPVATRSEDLAGSGAGLGVVVAYGSLIPAAVLEAIPMVNLHFSLLPRWRGAAPVERAILAGDSVTGACLMALDEGLDTGGVYDRREVAIGPEETAAELRGRLVQLGTEMLVERLADGLAGLGTPVPQEGEPTYAAKLTREDLHLDWSRPASELGRVVRCGRAWTTVQGKRLVVLKARPGPGEESGDEPGRLEGTSVVTGDGRLDLIEVAAEGRAPMSAAAWLRGARIGNSPVLGT
jgi:methionyl-tRNA formyltransferase